MLTVIRMWVRLRYAVAGSTGRAQHCWWGAVGDVVCTAHRHGHDGVWVVWDDPIADESPGSPIWYPLMAVSVDGDADD